MLVTAISGVVSGTRNRASNSKIPIGISVKEMYLTMLLMRRKSLESAGLIARASDSSLLIKLLAPTEVAVAIQVPETTKLPEVSVSPAFF